MTLGRLPKAGAKLCSQPATARLENLPGVVVLNRMTAALAELFYDSFGAVPRRFVLGIVDAEAGARAGRN